MANTHRLSTPMARPIWPRPMPRYIGLRVKAKGPCSTIAVVGLYGSTWVPALRNVTSAQTASATPIATSTPPVHTWGIPAGMKGREWSQSRPRPTRNASAHAIGGGISTLALFLVSLMGVSSI